MSGCTASRVASSAAVIARSNAASLSLIPTSSFTPLSFIASPFTRDYLPITKSSDNSLQEDWSRPYGDDLHHGVSPVTLAILTLLARSAIADVKPRGTTADRYPATTPHVTRQGYADVARRGLARQARRGGARRDRAW